MSADSTSTDYDDRRVEVAEPGDAPTASDGGDGGRADRNVRSGSYPRQPEAEDLGDTTSPDARGDGADDDADARDGADDDADARDGAAADVDADAWDGAAADVDADAWDGAAADADDDDDVDDGEPAEARREPAGREGEAEAGDADPDDGENAWDNLLSDPLRYQSRWDDIQAAFVDEPRRSVTDADALVAEVIDEITAVFAAARTDLEDQWSRGDEASTEDLRLAFRRYRGSSSACSPLEHPVRYRPPPPRAGGTASGLG